MDGANQFKEDDQGEDDEDDEDEPESEDDEVNSENTEDVNDEKPVYEIEPLKHQYNLRQRKVTSSSLKVLKTIAYNL